MADQAALPLVTVAITNYNYAHYLPEAIDSALAQTHPAVEVIVVDDGSTDNSREVIESYGGKVRPLFQRNAGHGLAIMAGLREALGEYLIILDADDTLTADVVERAMISFRNDPTCVRVQYRLARCDAAGKPIGELEPPIHLPLKVGDVSSYVRRYRNFRAPPMSGNCYRTATVRSLPPPPPAVQLYVDWWWSQLTARLGTIQALEGVGGTYRIHGTNHHLSRGWGLPYFRTRVAVSEAVDRAAAEMTTPAGGRPRPVPVDRPLDASLRTARLMISKLDPDASSPPTWRLTWQAAVATAVKPDVRLPVRARRTAWVLVVGIAPRGSRLVERLVSGRYE